MDVWTGLGLILKLKRWPTDVLSSLIVDVLWFANSILQNIDLFFQHAL